MRISEFLSALLGLAKKKSRSTTVLKIDTHSIAECGCDYVSGKVRTPCAAHRDR